ncbi:MAG: hypothetical protein OXH86_13505 [Acidimicrobiaceae bacterium]|nr:hypothetical protein [Acidimicrobiaceae bacterium]
MQHPVGLDDAQFQPGQSHPHRGLDLGLGRRPNAGGETAFGHAPQRGDERVRHLCTAAPDERRRHLGTAAEEAAHRRQLGLAGFPAGIGQIQQERCRRRREFGPVAGHQLQGRLGVPFVLQNERRTHEQRQAAAVNGTDAVAER